MNKAYYEETYRKEISATVTKVEKTEKATEVYLDKTIFYPECGGQPGDRGSFGPYEVLDTRKADDGDSIHIFSKDCPVKTGDTFNLVLDWNHRYKYMAMHTCQHLLSGLLFSEFSIGTVAVHLGEDYITIETEKSEIDQKVLVELVKIANQKILENHKIIYHEMSHKDAEALGLRRSIKVEGDVRIVEIEGVDRIACGGVHVSSTSEIRLVYFYGHEAIRGHMRLFFRCGQDAVNYLLEDTKLLNEIAGELACSPKEALGKLKSSLTELSDLKFRVKEAEESKAKEELSKYKDCKGAFETKTDLSAFVSASNSLSDACFCIVNQSRWVVILKGKYESIDFNKIRSSVLPIINAKGGGRTPVFQGIGQDMSKTEDFLKAFIDQSSL